MKRREKSFIKKDKNMKKIKKIITLLTLGLTAPCLIGMEPGAFPFSDLEIPPPKTRKTRKVAFFERGNRDYALAPKATLPLESYETSPREGASSTQESILKALPTGEPWDAKQEKSVSQKIEEHQKRLETAWCEALDTGNITLLRNEKSLFSRTLTLAADPDEKQVLSACIEKLQTLISMHEKHQSCLAFVLSEALETNQTAGLRLSLENRFMPALTAATDPDEKAVLLGCIAQLNAALNKLQFPSQKVKLEPKKHPYEFSNPCDSLEAQKKDNPFKPYTQKTLAIFETIQQQEVDNAMETGRKTRSTEPLQLLITHFAELMLDADTTPGEQTILNAHINTLQDEIAAQRICLRQQTPTVARELLVAQGSSETLHIYRHRKATARPFKEKKPEIKEAEPTPIASSSLPTPTQQESIAPKTTFTEMTDEAFQNILDAIHMEYQTTRGFTLLENTLKMLTEKNASESAAAKTLLFLKNNPQFLQSDISHQNCPPATNL
ncbi:hypothetical protein CVU75_02455 [Candidatus Dependentiae bacterium HGW-Dependentiae-1]|nr:MAG: hypothetical protein CVU75_02455 [Candidatus Dependentiae bacterium HGW-Dependentiae-1]